MCTICASLNPLDLKAADDSHLIDGSILANWVSVRGGRGGGSDTASGVPLDPLANQLTNGYWSNNGLSSRSFTLDASREITVDLTGLAADAQFVAQAALDAWSDVSGIVFVNVSGGAQITMDDNEAGAYSTSTTSGREIISSTVNIASDWYPYDPMSLNSYWMQTYMHEIGHAIGLGHGGNYNGSATWARDGKFANDSWQATVMSYFSQTENPNTGGASQAFTATTMAADIIAIQNLYGNSVVTRADDTVYGNNSNVDGYLGDMFDQWLGGAASDDAIYLGNSITMTLFDTGGIDTFDVSGIASAQRIDLNSEAKSDVAGLKGNIIIARGTVIENAIGGNGNDSISGNSAANVLTGGNGADALNGRAGNDTLIGGSGVDAFNGGDGSDTVSYETSTGPLTVDLKKSRYNSGDASGESYVAIENVIGGSGDDILRGSKTGSWLQGGEGADQLSGRKHGDTLDGGAGDDFLNGGKGSDTFVFNSGADTLYDFADNVDTISLARSLAGLSTATVAEALAFAAVEAGDIVFRFSATDILTLTGRTNIAALQDDLIFV
jgi:serralysin